MNSRHWEVELGRGLGDIDLGCERGELLDRLSQAGIDYDADDSDPEHVELPEMDVELTFSGGESLVLTQIAIQDAQVRFGDRPVLRARLHEITTLLQVQESETVWRTDDDPNDCLPGRSPTPLRPSTERERLERGTLWIVPFGLGLRLWRGEVCEIYLRAPEAVPRQGQGCLTGQELELSRRPDLANWLEEPRPPEYARRRIFRKVSGVLFLAAMAAVVWEAADFQRRWHAAPAVQATVIAISPADPATIPSEFIVEYRDLAGHPHQAAVGLADVYVPRAVGDVVELRFLPDQPGRPVGPGRIPDAAFVKYFPWGIGVLAGYLVVLLTEAVIWKISRRPAGLQT